MSRPNPVKLAVFLVGLIAVTGLPVLVKGGLFITNFEGDALHLADIVFRMAEGGRPHLDFFTPVGVLAFWPVVLGLEAGGGLGRAFGVGQLVFALGAGGAVWWAAVSRLPVRLAYLFAAVSGILLTSLSHGASGAMVAVSMHYNRWAWVLAFVAVILVLLPPKGHPRPLVDGGILAGVLAAMALLKATYVACFFPVLLLIAILRGDTALLKASLVAGGVLAALLSVVLGPAYIAAYTGDLWAAAQAPLRDQPGLGLSDVAVSPPYLVGTLALLAGMAFLRRAGAQTEGLSLLLLLPAFVAVTWQNFGNDPVWLALAGILLFALRPPRRPDLPPERDPSVGVAAAGFAALVLAVPLLQNHASGGVRLLTADVSSYRLLVPDRAGMGDVFMPTFPAELVRGRVNLSDPGEPYETAESSAGADHAPREFQGATLPKCQILTGIPTTLAALQTDLAAAERPVFVADLISSHWLYGPGGPLPGGAPWNYGTLNGVAAAGHVLVPLCPIDTRARGAILDAIVEEAIPLSLVRETALYRLYKIGG